MSYKKKSNTYLNFKSKNFHIAGGNEVSEKFLCLIATFDENIQKSIPLVPKNFQQLNGRVESVSLYEFFSTRFIAKFNLR